MKERLVKDEQESMLTQNKPMQRYYDYQYEEDEIDLKELLLVLIRGKKIIALTTIIILVITILGSVIIPNVNIGTKGEVQTVVKLYFGGINKGLTPDGLAYDPNEIKNSEVLDMAMDKMALKNKPAVYDVAECISLTAVLPDEVAETLQNISNLKTEELKLEKLESLEINPDTYIVSFNVQNKLGLSLEEGRELLDNVALAYKEQLMKKYSKYEILADTFAGDFDIDKYDYIQAADLLNEQIINMEQYAERNMTDATFTSKRTGMSKKDILDTLEAMKDVNIEMLYTKIAVSYATKDAAKSVAVYEKLAEDKEKAYSKSNEEANSLYALISNFKAPEQTLVLNNGQGDSYTLKNQNSQYDSMVTRYIQAGSKATMAQADSEYYSAEAERFKNADTFSGPNTKEAKEIVKLIGNTKDGIVKAMKTLNITAKDYYDNKAYQKYVEQLIPTKNYDKENGVNLMLNMAIAIAVGLFLGMLIVIFKEYILKEEQGGVSHEA